MPQTSTPQTSTPHPSTPPPPTPAAELRGARKGYGDVVAVGLLLGLLTPDRGEARMFGLDPRSNAARRRAGAMLQISKVPETLRVGEHLELFSSYYPRPLPAAEVLALAGLEGLEGRPYGKLSGGQKQRLLFALALCGDPDLLFLDEPTVGLDVASRRGLWRRVRELVARGRTVLLTTHYLEEAEALADRVVVLDRGRVLAQGTPAEIAARAGSRTVRCHTRLPLATVATLPGVVRAERQGGATVIFAAAAEALVRRLLEEDPGLAHLEVRGTGLEDAFLALTGGAPHSDDARRAA